MSGELDALVLDLVEWVAREPRSYAEVFDAWRTSCPRLPVWEEANASGFIEHQHAPGHEASVSVSPAGLAHLRACRAQPR
jgi:D-3-phosphoglycerate dehydrogenase